VPNLVSPPTGCRFHPRCPHVMEICPKEKPPTIECRSRGSTECRSRGSIERGQGHLVACHLYTDGKK